MWYSDKKMIGEEMLKETIRSCAFTGHRPKSFSFGYSEDSKEFQMLYTKMKNTVIQVCNAGCRRFYCGMAEGVDLWCGEIVLSLQNEFDPPLEIFAVVPYLAQPASMTEINQRRYHRIMARSKERFLISREFTKACFSKRNRFLVDSADALIAVYNESEYRSGTGQTVRYAKSRKKRIFQISVTESMKKT